MISLLGCATLDDPEIRRALTASVQILGHNQTESGLIPNNVDTLSGRPNFRAYADGGLWYVIGSAILQPDCDRIERALRWYECQDVDQTGLISIQESSDWQDLFCTRGKGLYVNCLHAMALERAAHVLAASGRSHERYRRRAELVKAVVNDILWYRGDADTTRHIAHSFSTDNLHTDSLGRKRWIPVKRVFPNESYYLPYVSFREIGEWFDVLGNLLAILSGAAGPEKSEIILTFIEHHDLHESPIKSIYPEVRPGDPDWRDYYASLNLPGCYHNGGIWPFIGGFYIAALVKTGQHAKALSTLERLADLNIEGEFNEWHDGATAEPMGVADQAWSAAMYIYAHECVKTGLTPFL